MKINEYFSDLGPGSSTSHAINIKVYKGDYKIYDGSIMSLLDNEKIANLELIDDPDFTACIGYEAHVK